MMDHLGTTSVDELDGDGHTVCDEGDNLVAPNRDYEATQFDTAIGHIEDIIMEDDFQSLQRTFMEKYWHEFDDCEENKLVYMDIFNEYIGVIEQHIETRLNDLIPDFSMTNFLSELIEQKDSLDGEIFEVLFTFSDFSAFKEMFQDYRAMKEGIAIDFSEGITITALPYEED